MKIHSQNKLHVMSVIIPRLILLLLLSEGPEVDVRLELSLCGVVDPEELEREEEVDIDCSGVGCETKRHV